MLPLVAAAVSSAAGKAVSSVSKKIAGNDKDADRLRKNAELYAMALAGDVNAGLVLKYMSGHFGCGDVPVYGRECGWADTAAKNDAFNKWQAINGVAVQGVVPAIPTGAGDPTLKSELQRLVNNVVTDARADVAAGVQRIGAGVVNATTQAVAPDGDSLKGSLVIPTTTSTLTLVGLGVGALLVVVWLAARARGK